MLAVTKVILLLKVSPSVTQVKQLVLLRAEPVFERGEPVYPGKQVVLLSKVTLKKKCHRCKFLTDSGLMRKVTLSSFFIIFFSEEAKQI